MSYNIFLGFPQIICSKQHTCENLKTPKKWHVFLNWTLSFRSENNEVILIDKNHQKLIIKIIDQCPVYLILKRSLKNLCVKDSLIFWISTMWYTHYNLVFDKKNSNTHVLINLSKNTRQALDEDSFGRGIFVNLQKAFDTVDHKFLLHKLE